MTNPVHEFYGNRLRVRACGLCVVGNDLLLVNHRHLGNENFWAPPGGGIEFGEHIEQCLVREFREETGLEIEPKEFLFTTEFISPPLHAIEFFFRVEKISGTLKSGNDPEMKDQIIRDVQFISWSALKSLNPGSLHGIFKKVPEPSKIMGLRGYFKL
ncbi:MAG TPA: NUDIX hydrolase [Cyclobacteriaceae bacterium]